MFKHIFRNEMKNVFREPMYLFFSAYPMILGAIGYFLVPYLAEEFPEQVIISKVVAMFFILMTSYIYGAVTGFTLLDDKDDKVLMSLKITPVSTKMYVLVKLIIGYVFGFIATLIIVYATGFLDGIGHGNILLISAVASLQAPFLALVVNSFADNKVEGFVVMKGTGMTLILPVVAFWLTDWKEFFLIIAPGFWPARMIQMKIMPTEIFGFEYNLNFIGYFLLGLGYNLVLAFFLFRLYAKRSNI